MAPKRIEQTFVVNDKMSAKFKEIAQYTNKAYGGLIEFNQAVDATNKKTLDPITDSVKKLQSSFSTIGNAAKEAMSNITNATSKAVISMQNCEKAAKAVSSSIKTAGQGIESIGSAITKIGKTGAGLTGTLGATMTGIGVAAGKTSVDFIKLYESTNIVFEKMLGTSEAANKMYDDLLNIAKASTFSQEAFLNAGKALVGTGIDAQHTTSYLQAIADAVTAFGGTSYNLENTADAFKKIATNGKLSMEEINMLSDNGIQAIKILANQYGKSTAEMRDMISDPNGGINSSEALDKLVEGIEKGTNGPNGVTAAMEDMAKELKGKTLTGAFDSLHSSIRSFSLSLLGLNPTLRDTDEAFQNQKHIRQLTAGLQQINEIIPNLTKFLKPVTKAFDKLLNIFVGANPVYNKTTQQWEGVTGALGKFNQYLKDLPQEKIDQVTNSIGKFLLGGNKFWQTVSKGFNKLKDTIKKFDTSNINKLITVGFLGLAKVKLSVENVSKSFQDFEHIIKSPNLTVIQAFIDLMSRRFPKVGSALQKVYNLFEKFKSSIGKFTGSPKLVVFINKHFPKLAILIHNLSIKFEELKNKIGSYADSATGKLNGFVGLINRYFPISTEHLQGLLNKFDELKNSTKNLNINTILESFKKLSEFSPGFPGLLAAGAALVLLGKTVRKVGGGLEKPLSLFFKTISVGGGLAINTFSTLAKTIGGVGKAATSLAGGALKGLFNMAGSKLTGASAQPNDNGLSTVDSSLTRIIGLLSSIEQKIGKVNGGDSLIDDLFDKSEKDSTNPVTDVIKESVDTVTPPSTYKGKVTDALNFGKKDYSFTDDVISSVKGAIPDNMGTGAVTNFVDNLTGSFKGLGQKLFDASGLSTLTGKVGDVFSSLRTSMVGSLGGITSTIGSSLGGIGSTIMDVLGPIGPVISGLIPTLGGAASGIAGLVTSFAAALPMIAAFVAAVGVAVGALGFLNKDGKLSQSIDGFFSSLPEKITSFAQTITTTITEIGSKIVTYLNKNLPDLTNRGVELITSLISGITTNIPLILQAVLQTLGAIAAQIVDAMPVLIKSGMMAITGLAQGMIQGLGNLLTGLNNVVTNIVTGIANYLPTLLQRIGEMFDNLINGFVEGFPKVIESIKGFFARMGDNVKQNMPKMLEAGGSIILNLAKGIINAIPKLVQGLGKVIQTILSGLLSLIPSIIQYAGTLVGTLVTGIWDHRQDIWNGIVEFGKTIWDALWSLVTNIAEAAWNIGKTIVTGIWDGVKSLWDSFVGWLSGKTSELDESVENGTIEEATPTAPETATQPEFATPEMPEAEAPTADTDTSWYDNFINSFGQNIADATGIDLGSLNLDQAVADATQEAANIQPTDTSGMFSDIASLFSDEYANTDFSLPEQTIEIPETGIDTSNIDGLTDELNAQMSTIDTSDLNVPQVDTSNIDTSSISDVTSNEVMSAAEWNQANDAINGAIESSPVYNGAASGYSFTPNSNVSNTSQVADTSQQVEAATQATSQINEAIKNESSELETTLNNSYGPIVNNFLQKVLESVKGLNSNILTETDSLMSSIGEKLTSSFSEKFEGVKNSLLEEVSTIAQSINSAINDNLTLDGVKNSLATIGALIGTLASKIVEFTENGKQKLTELSEITFNKPVNDFIGSLSAQGNAVMAMIEKTVSSFNQLRSTVMGGITAMISNGTTNIQKVVELVCNSTQTIAETLTGLLKNGIQTVKEELPDVIDMLTDLFNAGLKTVKETLPVVLDSLTDIFNRSVKTIKETIPVVIDTLSDILDKGSKALKETALTLMDTLTGIVEKGSEAVANAMRNISGGVSDSLKNLKSVFDIDNNPISNITDKVSGSIPKYASGTENARKGLALVGEEGPELVNFNGGESVLNNRETFDAFANSGTPSELTNLASSVSTTDNSRTETTNFGDIHLTVNQNVTSNDNPKDLADDVYQTLVRQLKTQIRRTGGIKSAI